MLLLLLSLDAEDPGNFRSLHIYSVQPGGIYLKPAHSCFPPRGSGCISRGIFLKSRLKSKLNLASKQEKGIATKSGRFI
jgi:hypothetical protein